jgi:hypothetical protein
MAFEIGSHEALTIIVKQIFKESGVIRCDDDIEIVIASSFENMDVLKPIWDLAVDVACAAAPWLKQHWNETPAWTMNLFTPTGLLEFPVANATP